MLPEEKSTKNQIVRILCKVLSDRSGDVDWSNYTLADWNRLVQKAALEGVAPLIYWKFKDSKPAHLPEAVWDRLRQAYYQTYARNQLIYFELCQILDQFSQAGIDVVVLKGAALVQTIYEDPGLRPMNDLDLLVHPQDSAKAIELVRNMGYIEPIPEMGKGLHAKMHHDIHLQQVKNPKLEVEVHWDISIRKQDNSDRLMEWYWQQTEKREIDGFAFKILNPTANLVYLSNHLAIQHGFGLAILVWFYDVYRILEFQRNSIGWESILQPVLSHSGSTAVFYVLMALGSRFDVSLDNSIATKFKRKIDQSEEKIILTKMYKRSSLAEIGWNSFKSLKRLEQFQIGMLQLFPSSEYLIWRYQPNPTWLWPFYYFYRWVAMLRSLISIWLKQN